MTIAPAATHAAEPAEPARHLGLQGAVNFRDLGGYRGVDGRRVRWRTVYRADSLAELSDADLARLHAIGLQTVVDLRHDEERQHRPSRLPAGTDQTPALQTHALGFYPTGGRALLQAVRAGTCSARQVADGLRQAYAAFPLTHREPYARMLALLASARALPALVHCTSGKDRTGFASAVLLMALGVDRGTIQDDYLLTNQYRRDLAFMVGAEVDPAVMDALTQAHPSYLAAAFEAIDQHWGGTPGFLREGLDLSAAAQARLQGLLLD
jgi:protein-tyrosine phosphatase